MNKQRHQVHLSVLDKKIINLQQKAFIYVVSTLHLNHTVGGAAVSIELKYLLVCHSRVVFIRAYNEKQKKKCIYFLLVPTEHDQGVRWLFQESKHFMMASLSNLKLRKDLEERCSQLLLQTTCCPLVELHVSDGSAESGKRKGAVSLKASGHSAPPPAL